MSAIVVMSMYRCDQDAPPHGGVGIGIQWVAASRVQSRAFFREYGGICILGTAVHSALGPTHPVRRDPSQVKKRTMSLDGGGSVATRRHGD